MSRGPVAERYKSEIIGRVCSSYLEFQGKNNRKSQAKQVTKCLSRYDSGGVSVPVCEIRNLL